MLINPPFVSPNMGDAWEMRWETRHINAVKDYERREKEGKVEPVDMTDRLDRIDAARS